jgi:peptidyl-prolyl cis-trans isomerase C
MARRWIPALFASFLAFTPLAHAAESAAMVNGIAIPETEVEQLVRSSPVHEQGQKARELALNSLVNGELMVQAARRGGLDKTAEAKQAIEAATRQILANAAAAQYLKSHPLSDTAVRARYDEMVRTMPKEEFRLRHILTKSKEEAEEVAADLRSGKTFEQLAPKSLDKASADKGGELGWVPPNLLRPGVEVAVTKLKPAEVSVPIQTELGWEVVQWEEKRPTNVPTLEAVKEQIRERLQQEAIQGYIAELRGKATIKLDAVETKKP